MLENIACSSFSSKMSNQDVQTLVEDATLDFTLGDNEEAIKKLEQAININSQSFEAWHALAEVYYSDKFFDRALQAAEKAYALSPKDIHINTSLSRIWMELGDKTTAEKFGAQARMLNWKDDLQSPQNK